MRTTETEETIEIGQVGQAYKYTACTLDSEVEQENLKYVWTVTWEQAKDTLENYTATEISSSTSRVATVKFLRQGTFTLRCAVYADDAEPSIGTFVENLPSAPVIHAWYAYTACTPDTQINPVYIEYLWIIKLLKGDEWIDATPWIETQGKNSRVLPIRFNYPGVYKLQAVAFSALALDVYQESTVCETIGAVEKIGNVDIVRGKNRRFGAVHKQATAPNDFMEYEWKCEGAEIDLADKRVCRITFGSYGQYTVQCTVKNVWAYDSPVVATMVIDHGPTTPPDTQFPNWQKPIVGARIFTDSNEFLGNPVHRENYNPNSQANRFWKIWLDDVQGHSKRVCVVEDETGQLVTEIVPYQHANIPERWVSIELVNIGTGNQFEDDHMDVRLYTMEKEEHPYNFMYVPAHRYFYLGVHRRETKKLPFNIAVRLGAEYKKIQEIEPEDRKYIMNLHDISPHW